MNGSPGSSHAQTPASPSGLMLIDKPLKRTSMDVCRWVRRRLVLGGAPKRVKVGHAGTLDPLATGLLVVLVGKATRLCDALMLGSKTYIADVDLSAFTTTDDAEGPRQEVAVLTPPTIDAIRAALPAFVGTIMQRPPAYSAIKVQGQRAYDLARDAARAADESGNTPPEHAALPVLPPRPVRIDAIEIIEYRWPLLVLRIDSGKGVYIRSLARDLGVAMGTGGSLLALRRTRIAPFDLANAVALDALPPTLTQADLLPIPASGAPGPGAALDLRPEPG